MNPTTVTQGAAKRSNPSASHGAKISAPHDIAGSKDTPGSRTKVASHSTAKTRTEVAAAAPKPLTRQQRRRAAEAGAAAAAAAAAAASAPPVRYGDGTRFDQGARYFVADPVPLPLAGTATVKLEMGSRTDAALAAFGESHIEAMTGNVWFLTPVPTAEVFEAKLAAFEAKLAALDNLRVEAKNLTFEKDQARKEFEFAFSQRRAYVQTASNSNAEVIASAGLSIRNPPTPVGALLPPLGLRVELTTFNGELDVRWNTVAGAKSYVLECAEVIAGQELLWVQVTMGGKLSHLAKQLTPGKHYAFRVASIGGSNGVSQWSPVVQRMAA